MVEYLESIEVERGKGKKNQGDKNQLEQKCKGIKETCGGEQWHMWFGVLVVFCFVLNIKLTHELFWELKIQPVRDAVSLRVFRRCGMSVPAQGLVLSAGVLAGVGCWWLRCLWFGETHLPAGCLWKGPVLSPEQACTSASKRKRVQ